MWRDYAGLLPSSAAIVNGLIAVLIAQFFKERPAARIFLVGMASILAVAAVGATFCGQSQVVAARDADQTHRRDLREALGSYIEKGNELELAISNSAKSEAKAPIQEENNWYASVIQFLREKLGSSYVARFHDLSGIGRVYLGVSTDDDHQSLFWSVYTRRFRLEQFVDQFPY
jgi:hypothetical protein